MVTRISAKILIIDNDDKVRKSLEKDLGEEGYQVFSVTGGEEALQTLEKKEFDLAVLELQLTDMKVEEVMRRANRSYPETQLIILTEDRTFESAVRALQGGAVDYLLKPYDIEDLLNRMRWALSERATYEQKRALYQQVETTLKKLKHLEEIETSQDPPQGLIMVAEGALIDLEQRYIWRDEESAILTPNECLLLGMFPSLTHPAWLRL